jgi:lysyl-tRNA synthetase class 2
LGTDDHAKRKQFKLPVKSPRVEDFRPLLEALDAGGELNEVLKNRIAKACQLLDEGHELYPNDFVKTDSLADILDRYEARDEAALAELGRSFTVAGRMVSLRSFGKVTFFNLQEGPRRLQCFASREDMGQDAYTRFKKFDIGDIVGLTGPCSAPKPANSPCTAPTSACSPSPSGPCPRSITA